MVDDDPRASPRCWGVEALGAHGVVIRLVVKTRPLEQWAVARELRARIKPALDTRASCRPRRRRRSSRAPAEPGARASLRARCREAWRLSAVALAGWAPAATVGDLAAAADRRRQGVLRLHVVRLDRARLRRHLPARGAADRARPRAVAPLDARARKRRRPRLARRPTRPPPVAGRRRSRRRPSPRPRRRSNPRSSPQLRRARLRDRLGKTRAAFAGYLGSLTGHARPSTTRPGTSSRRRCCSPTSACPTTTRLLDDLRERAATERVERPRRAGRRCCRPSWSTTLGAMPTGRCTDAPVQPNVWMFVGVNGVGKTTTIAKLAQREVDDGPHASCSPPPTRSAPPPPTSSRTGPSAPAPTSSGARRAPTRARSCSTP